ncbi:MAG TPA: 2-oxo-tetronate isomerase, partial [Thermohalobaculum sp.]|nr:2-oxo-tetronate isomerase [Thermohalobaculum sp.]
MPRFAANLTTMFTERPLLERFDAAAAAGFRAVEVLRPYDWPAARLRAALDRAGLELALLNTPPGDWAAGERGLAALPGREAAFRASLARALDYAALLRPARVHVMAGIASGEAARAAYRANLAWAAETAGAQGLTIEPINSRDMPGYHLATSDDAVAVLDAVGAANLGLQLDLYHAQIMEGDLTRRIERLMPRIAHMQIAGVPERHEPDAGEVNYPHLFALIDRLGYAGFVGCEYRPRGR